MAVRERLDGLKGKWLLRLNDSPEIRERFAGYACLPIERANGINHRTQVNPIYRELLVAPQSRRAELSALGGVI